MEACINGSDIVFYNFLLVAWDNNTALARLTPNITSTNFRVYNILF